MRSPGSSKCECLAASGDWGPRSAPLTAPPLCPTSIFPSPEQESPGTLTPAAYNTGGSLPDLTHIHFPPPLPTPLDPEEPSFPALNSSGSAGNLAANLIGLGGAPQGRSPNLDGERAGHCGGTQTAQFRMCKE